MADAARGNTLNVYEIACLSGGRDRIVDAALVALVRSGRVRVQGPGELVTADPTRAHPVEAAVLDAIGSTGPRSVETIRWRLRTDQRLDDVVPPLRAAGLVSGSRLGRMLRRDRRRPSLTPLGRRELDLLNEEAQGDDTWRTALRGPGAMADQTLRSRIFDLPVVDPRARSKNLNRRMHEVSRKRIEGPTGPGI